MKKIILYHPKTDHENNYLYYWIPYSILTIASACESNGFTAICIDANAGDESHFFDSINDKLHDVLCVGISCMTGHQIENGLRFAKKIRMINPSIPLIWGGTHPTLFPKQTLENELVDYVIQGQGEVRLPKLLKLISENRQKPYMIEGVGEKAYGKIYLSEKTVFYDKKYFPKFNWDLLDIEKYVKQDDDISTRVLNYLTSQGCPFHCGFCSEVGLYDGNWTCFDVDRVIDDISYLVSKYSLNGIKFYDANFFGKKSYGLTIAKRLTNLKIKWAASGHPATLSSFTDDEWLVLKESGCARLLIGLESGSQAVLNSIRKSYKIEKALHLAEQLAKYNIIGSFTFIVGFPNRVDEKEVEKTIALASAIRKISEKHECKIHFYAPYPGTPLWEDAKKMGFVEYTRFEDWSNFDYYRIETPWIPKEMEKNIRFFNEENCPYVHL